MTISEQIEKLNKKYQTGAAIPICSTSGACVDFATALFEALSIIRALTAPPTETEMRKQFEEWVKTVNQAPVEWIGHSYANAYMAAQWEGWKAAISAFLKGRGA